ncbi:ATP-binding protein [Saccharothrix syringae]|uniref:ATP-binding protein n=1 Tax=Saccharothrix syringae TaxID=103733 RepID=A0A5Q0H775_SACSY|nr:ATP-binding protein [Saccharothrix syringae]QFZ21690.1 ATP-binding protein [Saccharothrix syringae]
MTDDVGTPDAIGPRVADLVRGLAERAALSRGQAYRLRLAADEIATNIIVHGYGGVGRVEVCGGVDGDRVWVRTEDCAPPFDPRGHDVTALLATDPAERPLGGFGLHVAMAGLDEFHYEHVDGRNRNTMVVCRRSVEHGGGPA